MILSKKSLALVLTLSICIAPQAKGGVSIADFAKTAIKWLPIGKIVESGVVQDIAYCYLAFQASALCHELGHAAVYTLATGKLPECLCVGNPFSKFAVGFANNRIILAPPTGGIAAGVRMDTELLSPGKNILIYAAGPIAGLVGAQLLKHVDKKRSSNKESNKKKNAQLRRTFIGLLQISHVANLLPYGCSIGTSDGKKIVNNFKKIMAAKKE